MDIMDISGKIGPLYPQMYMDRPWPMYSYTTPAWILWNAIAGELHKNGWNEDQIKRYLQSKHTRWDLDGELGDKIEKIGRKWARKMVKDQG